MKLRYRFISDDFKYSANLILQIILFLQVIINCHLSRYGPCIGFKGLEFSLDVLYHAMHKNNLFDNSTMCVLQDISLVHKVLLIS